MAGNYADIYKRSLDEPEEFWAEAAQEIHWHKKWDKTLDDSNPPFYRWFAGGEVNTCYNALDRHVESGRADQLALIYDSPITGSIKKFTYRELRDETALFAGALAAQGVGRGDRVLIYMAM
ncbi:MAG: AMP-binding protein, partial [Nitrospinaceae bacterium]|nr:AMP-binding protein [Nitrospinaceae bacterium]